MKDLIYLDANFLIATQIEQHPMRASALQKLGKLNGNHFCISYLTIDETIYALNKYINNKKQVYGAIQKILKTAPVKIIGIENNNIIAEKFLRFWVKTKLAPRDAFHIFIMKQNGIKKLATFDNDFTKLQKELKVQII